jgi:hypothetical protein
MPIIMPPPWGVKRRDRLGCSRRKCPRPAGHHEFLGEPERLRNPSGIVREAVGLHPRAIIQLGILLLILTPVVRVAFTVLVFLAQRDVKFVAITVFVLAVLLLSLLGARLLSG